MKPQAFFRTDEVSRLLGRAAHCAATPLSLHALEDGQEKRCVVSHGTCAACEYVARVPGGKAACQRARMSATGAARRLQRPTPFVCHMGFACLTVFPLPEDSPDLALTFGPYCPREGADSLVPDAMQGLARFHVAPDKAFSQALAEIPILPATAIPDILQWTVEEIRRLWTAPQVLESPANNPEEHLSVRKPSRSAKPHVPSADPYQAHPIAAALAGGAQSQARALVRAVLSESQSAKRTRLPVKRARSHALVAAVLEAAERAGIDTTACRANLPQFMEAVQTSSTDPELVNASMGILSVLKRKAARDLARTAGYAELTAVLLPRLSEAVTLNDVAKALGQNPTAITHRLQRNFGMSFSEYLGRLRIDKAKELLRRTKLSVTEVARRTGVTDQSNFAKLFKKFEAMSPLEYRERFGRTR